MQGEMKLTRSSLGEKRQRPEQIAELVLSIGPAERYPGSGLHGARLAVIRAGAIRAEAYSPSQGEFTHATMFGPGGNRLVQGDYAVSPDLAQGHRLG
jgi:hypothetical protein